MNRFDEMYVRKHLGDTTAALEGTRQELIDERQRHIQDLQRLADLTAALARLDSGQIGVIEFIEQVRRTLKPNKVGSETDVMP